MGKLDLQIQTVKCSLTFYVCCRATQSATGFPARKSDSKYTLTFGFMTKQTHAIYILLMAFLQNPNYQTQTDFIKLLFSRVE